MPAVDSLLATMFFLLLWLFAEICDRDHPHRWSYTSETVSLSVLLPFDSPKALALLVPGRGDMLRDGPVPLGIDKHCLIFSLFLGVFLFCLFVFYFDCNFGMAVGLIFVFPIEVSEIARSIWLGPQA